MSSQARIESSRANGTRSHGPLSAETKAISCRNSLRHGLRAAPGRVLPGESREEYTALRQRWVIKLQPRDGAEDDLVSDIVNARWMLGRAEDTHFDFLETHALGADECEAMRVEILMNKLTFDRRGPTCMYGLTGSPLGERGTSWQDSPEDPNTPSILVRQIEGCPKGCEELIANWRGLAQRLENNLPWQAYDRLLATRMLGRQPTDCGRDERVNVIFVASFALHPKGRVEAYEELKSDMGALELEAFKDRIRKRWPLLIDAQDTATARRALVDLVQGCIARLEAKLEVYRQLAEERPTRTATPLTPEEKRELERLRQFELACERRVHRCENAFWKHRRETERTENGGSGPEEAIRHEETAESKPDSGAGEEVTGAPNKNSTNEPSFGGDVPKVGTMEEVAALARELDLASTDLRRVRSAGFGAVAAQGAGGGVVPGAIAEAIFGRGPLLRPIT